MTILEMLGQSGLLTLLGMAVVFSFIIILILCMNLLRLLVHALKLDEEKTLAMKGNSSGGVIAAQDSEKSVSYGDDVQIVAAIAAAVHDKQLKL